MDKYWEAVIWQTGVVKPSNKVEVTPGNLTVFKGTLVSFHKAQNFKFIFQCPPSTTLYKDFVGRSFLREVKKLTQK